MKLICPKSELQKSVSIVIKAVPGKTTMPIVKHIAHFDVGHHHSIGIAFERRLNALELKAYGVARELGILVTPRS